jgi:circadian clock protein KaiB
MENSDHDRLCGQKATKTPFKFRVYIARRTRKSDSALARLRALCEGAFQDDYSIEMIDLTKSPHFAREHQIVATPAIFRTLPAPVRKSIGDLSKTDKTWLRLDSFDPIH